MTMKGPPHHTKVHGQELHMNAVLVMGSGNGDNNDDNNHMDDDAWEVHCRSFNNKSYTRASTYFISSWPCSVPNHHVYRRTEKLLPPPCRRSRRKLYFCFCATNQWLTQCHRLHVPQGVQPPAPISKSKWAMHGGEGGDGIVSGINIVRQDAALGHLHLAAVDENGEVVQEYDVRGQSNGNGSVESSRLLAEDPSSAVIGVVLFD